MPEKFDLPPYPLAEVLEVKHHRVELADELVKEKIKALALENQKLHEREADRDKVLNHMKSKVRQLREELDGGTTSDKIDGMKVYIKVVQERLQVEEKKVRDQQQQVILAEKNLEIAKNQLKARIKEEDKIKTHREIWEKETLRELAVLEEREGDEIGSTMFLSRFIQKKHEKKKE